MRFEASTKCNYNCSICPRDKLTRKLEVMSFGLFKKLFDKILKETKQYDTLTFTSMGEPLLDKTLDKKIEYAKKRKKNLSILILTNGSLLTVQRFKRLEDLGVTSVRVSFYGADPVSYSKVHGIKNKLLFHKVKNSILKIAQIKKHTKLLLTFNVVDKKNEGSVNDWIKLWHEKADLIEIWKPHNWVDGRSYRKVQSEKLATCGRVFNGALQVQVDGTINMCCFDYNGKLTIGDLKRQSLKDIFSSQPFKKILECHQTGNYRGSNLICENCDQLNKDKSDVMVYSSKFDIKERVKATSTTYSKII